MDSKNLIIVILIIVIVAVCALFAGMYIAGGQNDDDNDDVVVVNNTTEENDTVDAVENTQSQDTSNSSDSGNYVTADDGNKVDLSGTHRVWSDQDGAYIYVDDEGYYKDGYIISEDENGKINAIKDTRGEE